MKVNLIRRLPSIFGVFSKHEQVKQQIHRDFFTVSKFGLLAGLLPGLLGYHFLIWSAIPDDPNIHKIFGVKYLLGAILTAFIFTGERLLKSRHARILTMYVTGVAYFGAMGLATMYFYAYLDTSYLNMLAMGVTGLLATLSVFLSSYPAYYVMAAGGLVFPGGIYLSLYREGADFQGLIVLLPMFYLLMCVFSFYDHRNRVRILELNLSLDESKREAEDHLARAKALKRKQDGDYYLTSLLIDPLTTDNHRSDRIEIEQLSRQKKRFLFRNRRNEIGGDVNITGNIDLRGKRFTVFLNGDAMGKSLQGAGGALVLGSVFQSIILRTQNKKSNRFPEQWLRETILELQSIFEQFQGSMFVSIILGLVDEETGVLYYVNAEHPFLILYRDGQAAFLDESISMYKLGNNLSQYFSVYVHELYPGDVVIAASDGRDDIIPHGTSEIEADSDRILDLTTQNSADLKSIYRDLAKTGKITDDTSFMKLTLHKTDRIPHEEEVTLRRRVNESIRQKEYTQAADLATQLADAYPADGELVQKVSRIYYKAGDLTRSLDWAYRLYRREPENTMVLKMCAKLYQSLGNQEMADQFRNLLSNGDGELIEDENRMLAGT